MSIESGDSAASALTETNTTLTSSGTLTVTDLDTTDIVTSTVSGVVASGTTTGLGSDNTALLAMLNATANILDTETVDQLTWNFNSASESFDYLADGQSLTLTYTITVTDIAGSTDTQDIVITINGSNDAPVVTIESGDSATETLTETNATLTTSGTLTTTDLDLSDAVSSTVSSVVASGTTSGLPSDNAALLAMLTSTANIIDAAEVTDQLTWNFNSASESFDYLAAGQSLTLTYTITVTDSQGATGTHDVTITINGTNEAPVVTIESGDSAAETLSETNTTLTSSGTLTTTDLDLSDSVTSTISSVVASGTTTGLGSNNAALLAMFTSTTNVIDGSETIDQLNWNFNSASESFDYLAAGESLTLTYTITVTDTQGATGTQDVVITINGTNDAPVVTIESGDSAAETLTETNTTLTSSGTLTTTDLDLSDTAAATVSSVIASGTTTGLASDNAALLAMLTSTANVIDGTETIDQLTWNFNSATETFDYLAAGESLILTYTITVTDGQGATGTQDVVITVNGTNDAPVITIESGDSAAETLSENSITLTSSGTLTTTDLDLSDIVTSTTTSVIASGDTVGLGSDNAALLSMLTSTANFIDNTETIDQLTWDFDSGSEHFDYLSSGQTLTLTYTITVTDSQGATDTQDIVITIVGDNKTPIISIEPGDNDAAAINETNTTLSSNGTLTVTDSNLADTVTSSVTGVVASGTTTGLGSDNAALLAMLTSTTNVIDSTETSNQLTWNFNSATESFDYLSVGQTLSLTYTITVTDSQGTSDTQAIVITITGTNDVPVAQAGTNTATEDGSSISGTLAETDLDLIDTHTFALITDTTEGTTVVNSDGTYTFDPETDFQDLAAGETRDVTFVYEVTDNHSATSRETITITVTGTNDAPVAVVDNVTAVEAGGVNNAAFGINPNGNVFTNDTDPDASNTFTIIGVAGGVQSSASGSVGSGVAGLYGTLTINTDGTYSYVIDNANADVQALRLATNTLDDVFTYSLNDNDGSASTAQVTVTIQGSNDNPDDLTAIGLQIDENASIGSAVGSVTTQDLDSGDSFTYRLTDSAAGRFSIDNSGNITVADSTGLDFEDATTHNIEVEVTDIAGGTYRESFTISLNDLDEFDVAPSTDIDSNANEVRENQIGSSVGITALAIDNDGTNNTVTYFLDDDDGGRFAIDQATGIVTTTMLLDFESQNSHQIIVEARSSDGSSSLETFTINVLDANEAPLAFGESYTLTANSSLNLGNPGVVANDIDVDGDTLSSIIETQPTHGTLVQLPDGSIVYTPNGGFFGEDSFTYRATDGLLQSNIATVTLNVEAVPPPEEPEPEPEPESETETEMETESKTKDTDGPESGTGPQQRDEDDADTDTDTNRQDNTDGNINQGTQAIGQQGSQFGGFTRSFLNEPVRLGGRSASIQVISGFDFKSDNFLQEYEILDRFKEAIIAQPVDWNQWEQPSEEEEDTSYESIVSSAGSAAGLFSIGYVLWALRGGAFFTAVASSMPSWRIVDPTAILSAGRGGASGKEEDDNILG